MNKMVVSLFLALSLSVAFVSCEADAQYPILMWSEHAFENSKESISALQMTNVVDLLKDKVEASKAVNVVAIVKEGLTSRDLIR